MNKINKINKIVIVASGKGGVGKSTIAAGISVALARQGFKTGIMDADIYGPSIPVLFGDQDNSKNIIDTENGKKLVPSERYGVKIQSIGYLVKMDQSVIWRGPMASNAIKQLIDDTEWGELDYLIIDTPPGTGDIHITLMQDYNIDNVIIVTTPQLMALSDVRKAISMYKKSYNIKNIGIVENMSWFTPSEHKNEKYFIFGKGGADLLSSEFNIPFIAQIPIDESICANCDSGFLNGLFGKEEMESTYDKILDFI